MQTSDKKQKTLFVMLQKKGFVPKHVSEVGVYLPQTCNVLDFAKQGIRTTLVEANPRIVGVIEDYFQGSENITIHPVAVYDRVCELELFDRDASTFVGEVASSPAIVNDDYTVDDADRFAVDAVTFDMLDDGSIDLLSVDVEGSEWYVIKHMKSRPTVLSLETHGAKYVNPFLKEIAGWMAENDYVRWYRDKTDTVFVNQDEFNITLLDKINLALTDASLAFRRVRKKLFS